MADEGAGTGRGSKLLASTLELAKRLHRIGRDSLTKRREEAARANVESDGLGKGFELRRFAGPASYVEHFDRPLRVVHLTDQHVGRVTPMRVQQAAITLANEQAPDVVVLTGDFVCHGLGFLDALQEFISRLDAPVFAVLGNHDYWSGAKHVRATLKKAGAEVLDNANTIVELDGRKLQLVGLDDAYTGHADRAKAVKGLRRDVPTLGLSHIAEEADGLWAAGVPLVLAGHTHAGQVTLARLNEISMGRIAGHKYVHGLYGTRSRPAPEGAVYVGAGIGAAVVPLRLGDRGRREVTVFELGAAPGRFEEHHGEQPPLAGRKPSEKLKRKRALKVVKIEQKLQKKA